MKNYLLLIIFPVLLFSCNKAKEPDLTESLLTEWNIHEIYTVKGKDETKGSDIEVQLYKTLDDKKFVNQAIHYHKNGTIDSLNSHFYRLEFDEVQKNNYKGRIWLNYEGKKIKEIELKVATNNSNEPSITSFVANNSNELSFAFLNENSEAPLVGVLCIKIETDTVEGDEVLDGYYKRYIFVDSNQATDNLFIKKYRQ